MTHHITLTQNDTASGFTQEDVELLVGIYTALRIKVVTSGFSYRAQAPKTVDYSTWDTQVAVARKRYSDVMSGAPRIVVGKITCAFEVRFAYAELFRLLDEIRADLLKKISLASLAALVTAPTN